MIEINYEEGQTASQQAENERDMLIRGVFAEYQIEVVFDRSVPIGLDVKYDVRDKKTGKIFIIHDFRAIPCGPSLAADIRSQLDGHGATRSLNAVQASVSTASANSPSSRRTIAEDKSP